MVMANVFRQDGADTARHFALPIAVKDTRFCVHLPLLRFGCFRAALVAFSALGQWAAFVYMAVAVATMNTARTSRFSHRFEYSSSGGMGVNVDANGSHTLW